MTQNLDAKLRYVANKFAASNIKVNNEWLSGCIEFFCSEDLRISNEGLYENAWEQWLLADLAEVGEGCLPETLNRKKEEFILEKMYPVQMQWLLDISESCYDQLRNLYDKKLDEALVTSEFNTTSANRNDTKKNRVLKLQMTDGKITTHALEYNPISCLTTKLTPGCKIMLKGPIRCINKLLFLEPKNVQILGGEVDTLLIENAFENILLKQLGKPINPNPKTDYKESIVIERRNPSATVPIAEQIPFVAHQASQNVTNSYKAAPKLEQLQDVIMDDDDYLLDINLDEIESKAVFMEQPPSMNSSPPKPRPIIMEEDEQFLDDLDVLNDIENQIQNERNKQPVRIMANPPSQASTELKKTNTFDDFVDQSNFFDSTMDFDVMEIEANLVTPQRISTILDDDYEFKVDGINLATTDELLKLKREELEGRKFVLYCEIDSVAEKLQIKNCEYCLGVFLKDYTEKLIQARFHTDVLSKLADYTPQELQLMRQTEKERPHIKSQINQIFTKLKTVLQEIKCFMKISYCTNARNEFPTILELIYKTNDDINTLNRKRKN